MYFFCVLFFTCTTDTHRQLSNTLNDVRETPPTSSSYPSNTTNNRKLVLDDDLLVEDPNGLNNVEYIKLKKVLVQPMHDVDVLQYEPKIIDSSELGTGKKYLRLILSRVMLTLIIRFF